MRIPALFAVALFVISAAGCGETTTSGTVAKPAGSISSGAPTPPPPMPLPKPGS